MRQRLDLGTALQALGAVLVLIALFLHWYVPGGTAWRVFEITDLLLAVLAIAAIVATVGLLAEGDEGTPGWLQALGLATLVIVAYELLDKPPAARGASLDTGAWLALGGALVMALGAFLHRAHVRITIDVRERERRRRVAAVDRRTTAAGGADAEPAEAAPTPRRRRPGGRPGGPDAEAGGGPQGGGAVSGRRAEERDVRPSGGSLLDDDVERTQPFPPVREDEAT